MKYLYFLRPVGQPGPIKIGCSAEPADRLKALSVWSPLPLEIAARTPGTHEMERRLHRMFADSRSHSKWFNATPELGALIESVAAGVSITGLLDMTLEISTREHCLSDNRWRGAVMAHYRRRQQPDAKPRRKAA